MKRITFGDRFASIIRANIVSTLIRPPTFARLKRYVCSQHVSVTSLAHIYVPDPGLGPSKVMPILPKCSPDPSRSKAALACGRGNELSITGRIR